MRSTDLFTTTEGVKSGHIAGEGGGPGNGTQAFAAGSFYRYGVYGISLQSQIQLSLPEQSGAGLVGIELRTAPASFFLEILGDTHLQRIGRRSYQYAHLQDGSSYVRWDGIGEFLVSGGGRFITCGRFPKASMESFQVYLLGQALSFALVKNGFEPVHATCVVIDGEAVAFLGNSGFGKSSLAAYFLQAGDRLLTDDLLLVREGVNGLQAYPGPPRIKLLPGMARSFLGEYASGVRMNPQTRKLVIPLDGNRICAAPVPLRALYVLAHPRKVVLQGRGVHIRRLSSREAFVSLLSHAFNYVILDEDRLQRQFTETMRLTRAAPLSELSYPRLVGSLTAVRQAILSDLNKRKSEVPACGH
jgi:hypothetical protein